MLFKRYKANPIIIPDLRKDYEKGYVYNPCAIVYESGVYLIYRAEGDDGVSSLCLAISSDGINFEKYEGNPVVVSSLPEEKCGCEDPRITRIDDKFYLTYTAYDCKYPERAENVYTALAVSSDLRKWVKKGVIVKDIKAAAIYPEKIDGKYIMFIGGKKINLGYSKDLRKWNVEKKPLLDVRVGMFDSKYVEAGPAPFLYKDYLVLFFNTADNDSIFHPSLALIDKNDLHNVVYRSNEPLLSPTEKYEKIGKVNNVIFGSGLVKFKDNYFYYYGGADSCIAVATVSKVDLEKYLDKIINGL